MADTKRSISHPRQSLIVQTVQLFQALKTISVPQPSWWNTIPPSFFVNFLSRQLLLAFARLLVPSRQRSMKKWLQPELSGRGARPLREGPQAGLGPAENDLRIGEAGPQIDCKKNPDSTMKSNAIFISTRDHC